MKISFLSAGTMYACHEWTAADKEILDKSPGIWELNVIVVKTPSLPVIICLVVDSASVVNQYQVRPKK